MLIAAACNTNSRSEKAAENLNKQSDQLADQLKDKGNGAVEGIKDIAKEANDVAAADETFRREREIRIGALRANHVLEATIPGLIRPTIDFANVTDVGRANINEKLAVLELRLSEAAKAIEDLQFVDAANWKEKNEATQDFMNRLGTAADEAVEELRDAPRVEPARS